MTFWIFFSAFVALIVYFGHAQSRDRLRVLRYLLAARRPSYGLDMIERGISSRGMLYVILSRLEEDGLVKSWTAPGSLERRGLPRRMYELTPLGISAAGALVTR